MSEQDEKLTLYYSPISPVARTVLLVCKAINLDLNLKLVDLVNGEQYHPWYVAINPQHTVPTLVERDGRILWDSHAICAYLIGKYGGADGNHPLYPSDLYTRALIDQRMYSDTLVVFPSIFTIVRDTLTRGDTDVSASQVEDAREAYKLVQTLLADRDYIAGNELSLADFSAVTTITQLATQVPFADDEFANVQRWIERLEELPYFHETNTKNLVYFVKVMNESRRRNSKSLL